MGCLKTNNCCCCFSLRTGGLIMGWLTTIYSILMILGNVFHWEVYYRNLYERSQAMHMYIPREVDLFHWLFFLIIGVLLLLGIYNKKPALLFPDVVMSIIEFIYLLINIAIIIVQSIRAINSNDPKQAEVGAAMLWGLFLMVPFVALMWHFVAVIYSLYKKIQDEAVRHPGVAYHVGTRDPYKV